MATLPEEVSDVEIFALTMLCIGSALGLRFKVLVLVPTIFLGVAVCTAYGGTQGATIGWIALANVVTAMCLQFGYLGGALLKFMVFAGRRPDGTRSVRPFAH